MPRVLLVFPNIKSYAPRVPVTLLHLAAFLLRDGIDVEILDDQVDDFREWDPNGYDFIGFSIRTGIQIRNALTIAKDFRSRASREIPFIWGGVHVTIAPEETLRNGLVDYAVLYEGEETLVDLVKTLSRGGNRREVKGIMYVENGEIVKTESRPFIDINSTPPLPYHLIDDKAYLEIQRSPKHFYIVSSRGCPYKCGFCLNEKLRNRRISLMTAERTVDQFQHAIEYCNPDFINIIDDEVFVSHRRIEEICREIIRRGIKVSWTGSSRINWIYKYTDAFFDLLNESGFKILSLGAESGSEFMLQKIEKRITCEEMVRTAERIKGRPIISWMNFMVGFPGETTETLFDTFRAIDRLMEVNPDVRLGLSIYTPYPCTRLYPEALAKGFRPPDSLEGWGDYQYNSVKNLPWLKGRMRSIIRTVGCFSKFGFHRPQMEAYPFPGNLAIRVAFFVMQASAKLRWRYKFFWFPVEWRLFEWYLDTAKVYDR